ncbi:MAG: virulence RhuM family protein [Bacteroidales bacterium]|nr:virulence RhuM family protein [Bacteroidales bacterium]
MEEEKIVIYHLEESETIEVRVQNETVWLTQAQMALLFQRNISVISRHIHNAFAEGELEEKCNLHFLQIANSDRPVAFYSLDVIISVGYRVKSKRGTAFRKWATKVLTEHLNHGYTIAERMGRIEHQVDTLSNQVQSLVQTALPPKQGVFFDGQIFDAYEFVSDLIRSATESIVLIDNYADDSVLTQLTKREKGVAATICVNHIRKDFLLDVERHNAQYPPVTIRETPLVHDRFLLLDGTRLYTFGASFKDLGKKLFCFSLMESETVVKAVQRLVDASDVEMVN